MGTSGREWLEERKAHWGQKKKAERICVSGMNGLEGLCTDARIYVWITQIYERVSQIYRWVSRYPQIWEYIIHIYP